MALSAMSRLLLLQHVVRVRRSSRRPALNTNPAFKPVERHLVAEEPEPVLRSSCYCRILTAGL